MNTTARSADPAPTFSAVIPAYNCERYIARAVASVLAQRGVSVECIVVDDGSRDATASVVEQSFGAWVRLIRQPNGGASAARNAGIEAARGRYIAFLDADDFWLDSKLLAQQQVITQHPDVRLVSTLWRWMPSDVDPQAADFGGPAPDAARVERLPGWSSLLLDPYLCTPSVVVDAEAARRCGGFDVNLPSAEDIDFFLRVCAGTPYCRINQPLVHCQLRSGSLTQTELSHRHNLTVIDRVVAAFPEISRDHGASLQSARLDVYRRWALSKLFAGDGRQARDILIESRQHGQLPGYRRLWLKSYLAPAIRPLRDRLRPRAAEAQVDP